MNQNEYNILAAAMGHSNLGFDQATEEQFTRLLMRDKVALFEAVEFFSRSHMENDEHMQLFLEEAEGWKKRLMKRHDEDLVKEWPAQVGLFLRCKKVAERKKQDT